MPMVMLDEETVIEESVAFKSPQPIKLTTNNKQLTTENNFAIYDSMDNFPF